MKLKVEEIVSRPVREVTLRLTEEEALAILGALGRVISGPSSTLNLYGQLFDALRYSGLTTPELYRAGEGYRFSNSN